MVLGSDVNSDIYINSPYVKNDCIVFRKDVQGLHLDIKFSAYGVYVNGIRAEKEALLKEYDFFSVAGYYFCYKEGCLYTDMDASIVLNGLGSHRKKKESCFEYPLFNRSTRIHSVVPSEPIPILDPPDKPEKPKDNLWMSLLPSIAMLVLTVVVRGFMGNGSTFVIFSACTISIGIVTSIMTFLQGKKEYRAGIREREERYREYITGKCSYIESARGKEREILNSIYPEAEEIIQNGETFSRMLFDRMPGDEDFLCVRLGTGLTEAIRRIDYKRQEKFVTDDELAYIPGKLVEKYRYLDGNPIVLELKEANAVGIIGSMQDRSRMVRNMIVDLMARHYTDNVRFYYIMDESWKESFAWVRFVPQVQCEGKYIRNIACDADSRTNVFENLYKEFSERLERGEDSERQHILVFVLNGTQLMTHPLSRFIPIASVINTTFVFMEEYGERLPACCSRLVYVSGAEGKVIRASDGNETAFSYREIPEYLAERLAICLSPVYCEEINLEGNLKKNISLFELLGIYSAEDLDLTKRWEAAQTYRSLAAPLGVKAKDEVVSLDVHEKAHGPHGLVAGTTGSGKSEILQSYILSMATLYHPYEVGFLVIDFKGGGMANQFTALPHLMGIITNIDGKQINRSLLSIKAELLKRQSCFAEAEVNHIDKYIMKYKNGEVQVPLPHLIIIVDEFAELKAEYPEFMKELVSASRIGRSLGVHLILATQKPSGQVSEQIWSNSRFKLCLKVQSPEDSNEMIKSPLAAEIREPGRAYFQVGNNEIFELFQSGYSGAAEKYSEDVLASREFQISEISFEGKRKCIYKQKSNEDSRSNRTQLEAIVSYIDGYCRERDIRRLGSICLPPLEEVIAFPDVIRERDSLDTIVDIGILDDPDRQRQIVTSMNLTQDNTIIIGASQYGKTNLLQTVIRGLAAAYSPEQVNIYILDFGSMVLRSFENLCHVGGVVVSSEDEKFKNLIKLLLEEMAVRKDKMMKAGVSSFASYREAGKDDLPQIVLMIDNFTAVKECYLQEEDPVLQICREGISVGISVIISNSQTTGLGYRYLSNFSKRIVFYCNESGEYSNVIERCRIMPDNAAGRALTEINKEIYELQTYLSFEGEREIERVSNMRTFAQACSQGYAVRARRIPEIPEVLGEKVFAEEFGICRTDTYTVPVGLSYENISPINIDLLTQGWFAILGRRGGGKKNLLKIILDQLCRNLFACPSEVYIIDAVDRGLGIFKESGIVKEYTIDASDLVLYMEEIYEELSVRYREIAAGNMELTDEPLKLVVVRNMDAVENLCKNSAAMNQYRELAGRLKSMKICFIYMDVANAPVGYNAPEILKAIKDNRNFFFFDDLQNLKVCDIPVATVRKFRKKIMSGDGYWLAGNEVLKVKTVKSL